MTVDVNAYTRVRYGNEETVSSHQRGNPSAHIDAESGPYFSDRQMQLMERRELRRSTRK